MTIDFAIIGAQKAATSAIQAALRSHPDIYMPKGESPFFEDPDYDEQPWKKIELEGSVRSTKLFGIKRPDNLCSIDAISRISKHLPDARFIVVLREPISRAISSYCYLLRHAHLPPLPLDVGMTRCIDDFVAGRDTSAASVISYGLYGTYLEKWFAEFSRERFLVLSQEQVSKSAQATLTQCANHLCVDPVPLLKAHLNTKIQENNIGLYDPNMLRVARVGSLLKTRPVPNTRRRVPRSLLPRIAGTAITRYAEQMAHWRGQQRETICDTINERLAQIYAADLPLLRNTVPKDVLYWDKPQ